MKTRLRVQLRMCLSSFFICTAGSLGYYILTISNALKSEYQHVIGFTLIYKKYIEILQQILSITYESTKYSQECRICGCFFSSVYL